MDFLTGLNPQQQQAVIAGLGPILVMAGPGSGKTRVLTHRIAYLIGNIGVSPYHILAVTFTNKAAREMESRVINLLREQAHGLTLGTFHAACARILRREADHLPFESNFVIFDSDDQLGLVKRAIDELDLDEKRYRPHTAHAVISRAKNELLLPDTFPVQTHRDEVFRRIYERYQQLLLANNALDFDDLLLWTAMLMAENDPVREKYATRFEHVLVDEFQDTNLAQYQLLKHLTSFHGNLFVVGDVDQSIYRWRGADYRNLQRLERDYPEVQVILLEQNYRSTQSILNTAMAVIDRNPFRMTKKLFTERGEGQKVILYEAFDDRVEASFVVDTIAGLVARKEAQPGEIAVMYRINAQSRLLEEAFLHAGLPYRLVGAQRFYGRREIKDIIAYLRLIHNPRDGFSLTRILNVPARGIGAKTVIVLKTQASKSKTSPGEFLLMLGQSASSADNGNLNNELVSKVPAPLVNFAALLAGWREYANGGASPLQLMDRVLEDVDYQPYIDDGTDEGRDRWENVMELRRLAGEFQGQSLDAFLERVALVSDQDMLDESAKDGAANLPTLLTLHAAKGLEFPIVFIVGLNDGVLPHSRSFEDPEEMMEERRLFYVGITRAKDRLYLLHTQNRSSYGFAEPSQPSRFLDDIPYEMLEEIPGSSGTTTRVRSVPVDRWPSSPASPRPHVEQQYHPGMHVMHPVWGEGMILNSRIQDDDEIVDIFFENVGLKRVIASLAKLEVKSGM